MITFQGVIEVTRELDSERLNDYWRTPSLSVEIRSVRRHFSDIQKVGL